MNYYIFAEINLICILAGFIDEERRPEVVLRVNLMEQVVIDSCVY